MGELDLQAPFPRARPFAEDLQNQSRAVEDLGSPGLFQIALLHRGQRGIDDDDFGLDRAADGGDLVDLAGAEKRRGRGAAKDGNEAFLHVKPDGGRQRYGLFKPRLFGPARIAAGLFGDVNHDCPPRFARRVAGPALGSRG